MNRALTLGLAALLMLGSGCAGLQQGASVEVQVFNVIEAWKAAWLSSDIEATKKVYSKNFVGDFQPDILESEDFAEFVADADIDTGHATITIEGNTATVGPIYIEDVIEIQHTLTKESDGWKITGTKGEEM